MIVRQRDNLVWHRTNALLRASIVKGALRPFSDHVLVNEYPKSGGSWMAQMLGEALEMPFPRNRLPTFGSAIMQGHYLGSSGLRRKVVVWRDGRDVAVSWYYHFVVGHELTSRRANAIVRELTGYREDESDEVNFRRALSHFLEHPRFPQFTWAEFADRWANASDCVHVRYEDLKSDAQGELMRVFGALTGRVLEESRARQIVDRFSFAAQAGRKPGEEGRKSYLRNGVVGDWKSYFDAEASRLFAVRAGHALVALGYESDDNWVELQGAGI